EIHQRWIGEPPGLGRGYGHGERGVGLVVEHAPDRDEMFLADHARPSIAPAIAQDTSACSTFGTWLTAVPRTWRTASVMLFMPWMYASPIRPPLVFTGRRPPSWMLPSRTKSFASPRPQKPKPSSCFSTCGVKAS